MRFLSLLLMLGGFVSAGYFFWLLFGESLNRARIIFCDVGQGDATLFVYRHYQILIDTGPDKKVLACLDRYFPILDKKIELLILTHPDKDHIGGAFDVLTHYRVDTLVTHDLHKNTPVFVALQEFLRFNSEIRQMRSVGSGDKFFVGLFEVLILWPDKNWIFEGSRLLSNNRISYDSFDYNSISYVSWVKFGKFDALIHADAEVDVQEKILSRNLFPQGLEVMSAPHHGSKDGVNKKIVKLLSPQITVASLGKSNSYGHPHFSIVQLFEDYKIPFLRTDISSDVIFNTDGRMWSYRCLASCN